MRRLTKILSTALVAVMTISALGTHVFAADPELQTAIPRDDSVAEAEYQTVGKAGNNDCEIEVRISSSYTVSIPKKIVLDGKTKFGGYTVVVQGDIAGNEHVRVIPDNTFALKEKGGKADVTASVSQAKTDFIYNEIFDPEGYSTQGLVSAGISAGNWSGYFNFRIGLNISDNSEAYAQSVLKNINRRIVNSKVSKTVGEDNYSEANFTAAVNEILAQAKADYDIDDAYLTDVAYVEPVKNIIETADKTEFEYTDKVGSYSCKVNVEINNAKYTGEAVTISIVYDESMDFGTVMKSGTFNGATWTYYSSEWLKITGTMTSNELPEEFPWSDDENEVNYVYLDFDASSLSDLSNMFNGFDPYVIVTGSNFKVNKDANVSGLFADCPYLQICLLSKLNTESSVNVTTNNKMLKQIDLSGYDTAFEDSVYQNMFFSGSPRINTVFLNASLQDAFAERYNCALDDVPARFASATGLNEATVIFK